MEKTKIAFFMASPFTYGGEQRVVSVVASLLSKRTYDVSIICTLKVKEDYEMYDLDKNVKIIYIPKSISSFETFNKKVMNKILMYNKKIGILKNFPNIEKKLFATASFKKRLVK